LAIAPQQAFASFPYLATDAIQNCINGDKATCAANAGRAMQENGTFHQSKLYDACIGVNRIETWTAGTTTAAAASTSARTYFAAGAKSGASRTDRANDSTTTPIIESVRTFPRSAAFIVELNLALDLSDEFEYAARAGGNVKVRPIKVLKMYDASWQQVWKTGVGEL